jgi:hypothetical protein
MKKKDIIKLLKSGDFTIAYHDNACPTLYKGRREYEQLLGENEVELDGLDEGYCPEIVSLLTEALGGVSNSI